MLRKQRGITFLGWLILLVPVAIVFYAGIRVVPLYLNYMRVARALQQTADGLKTDDALTQQTILVGLAKRFDIEGITYPKLTDILVQRNGGKWSMEANYEDLAPLFAGISVLVKFDKAVPIGSAPPGGP